MRRARILLAFVITLGMPAKSAHGSSVGRPNQAPARVLVLFASPPENPAMRVFGDAFRLTLRNELPTPVEFYEEFLDFNRFGEVEHERQLAQYLATKYRHQRIDLVVAVERASLGFIREHLGQVFRGVPVVFGWIAESQVDTDTMPPYVTGVLSPPTIRPTLDMALRLQPTTKHVAVVSGSSPSDRALLQLAQSVLAPLRDSIEFLVVADLPHEEMLARLRSLPPQSIILFSSFMQDADGRFFVPASVVEEIAGAIRAPVYGNVDVWLGRGIVGGRVLSASATGASTGHLAATVLASPRTLAVPPPVIASAENVADWRQMRRWQLPDERLPPNTRMAFRSRTWWDETRATILAGVALVALQSALIALLLFERRRRRIAQALSTAVLRSASTPIAILDREGIIVLANPAWASAAARAGGLPMNDARVGASYVEGWRRRSGSVDGQASIIGAGIAAVLEGRACVFGSEYDGGESGESRFELLVERLDRAEGGAVVTHTDITERTNAERAREEWRRQAEHVNRAATLGELAASLSHELGQPLTSIRANAQAGKHMATKGTRPAEIAEIFADIEADSVRAGSIVHRVRAMLRKQAPIVECVALNSVCRGVANLLHSSALLRQTRIDLELEARLPNVVADRVQMEQVVLNLIMNAIDACASGSGDRVVRVRTAINGEREVVVSVIDGGNGIRDDVVDRLFEPFFTTKQWGLGVGLSIVRSLVTAHGGRVWAENAPRGGAAFHFSLPLPPVGSEDAKQTCGAGVTPTAREALEYRSDPFQQVVASASFKD